MRFLPLVPTVFRGNADTSMNSTHSHGRPWERGHIRPFRRLKEWGRLPPKLLRRLVLTTVGLCLISLLLAVPIVTWPLDTRPYLDIESSAEMLDRSGVIMYPFLNSQDQWCFERDLDDLGPRIIQATLAAEDHRFYRHPGVDPVAVIRAAWQNTRGRRIISGASTITMQVAKRAGPPTRSLRGKALQAIRALRLDFHCDKDAILRAYLNTAPYGFNLIGVEAAARRFFGKPARELTLAEAALLAGLPKAPGRLMPMDNPEGARNRRNYVLRRMSAHGFITGAELERALAEPLDTRWHDFPAMAPHVAMRFRPEIVCRGGLQLTLDSDIQGLTKRCVDAVLERYRGQIGNAAALVIDVPSSTVLAYLGSGDFFNTPGGGQVDACRAVRSPGSTLKPFTYALAMDLDLLYASEALLDDTLDYGVYSPENFDGGYNGLISATDALRHSLNVPAVMVLNRIGVGRYHEFLTNIGLTTLTHDSVEYGLGLTLGNCEVRLDELAAAYCMIANLGEYRPLEIIRKRLESTVGTKDIRFYSDSCLLSPEFSSKRCLNRGTCLKLIQMLEQPLPQEFDENIVRAAGVMPRVCWKTGTSTGYHDAWAIVFNSQNLVAVWMGNNDAKPSPNLVGARTALPLAGRIFRAIKPRNIPAWPDTGDDLRSAAVCALSGLPASEWCPRTRQEALPRSQYLHRVCDVHYPWRVAGAWAVNVDKGLQPLARVIERWPGSARNWDLAKVTAPITVTAKADKPANARRQTLRILDPADQAEYILTGEPQGDRIRLRASNDAEGQLYWYLDERYLGATGPERRLLLELSPGRHTVACMNPQGQIDKVSYLVEEPQGTVRFTTR